MLSKNLNSIFKEYLPRFKADVSDFREDDLRKLIQKAAEKAEKNYRQLKNPKTCSRRLYVSRWVREDLEKHYNLKTLRKLDFQNPTDDYLKILAGLLKVLSPDLVSSLNKKIWQVKPEEREKVWEKINLPIKDIEDKFRKVVESRNILAQKRGYSSFIELHLDKSKIPVDRYQEFTRNVDKVIKYCNQQLPKDNKLPFWFYSIFNSPCFVCKLSSFPFKTLNQVIKEVSDKYEVINGFRKKIRIKQGTGNWMSYQKKSDSFLINLDKIVNSRHQALYLIHELAHVVNYLNEFKKEIDPLREGKYHQEKAVKKIEINLLKGISEPLFNAYLGEILLNLRKTLFEIELHQNPNQDFSKLYAQTFNRCYKEAKQKENPIYLLNEEIIFKPFTTLPHAVAAVEVIEKFCK